MSTITAIATALGNSAISIVRLSGENSLNIAKEIFTSSSLDFDNIVPKMMYLGRIDCGSFHDQCLLVYFKAPYSYTGEDLVEFQCHGGNKIAPELLKCLLSKGAVLATKGEFSKRAFVNGKLTLSEAEGVIDMINAESTAELNCGYRLLSGKFNEKLQTIKDLLLDTIASYEAAFDYPEELEQEAQENACITIGDIRQHLSELYSTISLGKIIKNGINVAIIGAPNSGKSSLLNALVGSDKAIVSDIAGTTRDTIEARIEHNGILINFIDTAGIRDDSADIVESIGIQRAKATAQNADIIIFALDGSRETTSEELRLISSFGMKPHLIVTNKSDILKKHSDYLLISAKTGQNIDKLLDSITEMFIDKDIDTNQDIITNIRHVDCIKGALLIVTEAYKHLKTTPTECTIIDLNNAYRLIGEITGDTCSEDVIDRVFEKFCLGK